MFEQFQAADVKSGLIVPLVVNDLPGDPVIGVEHLSLKNQSFLNDEILKANAQGPAKLTENKKAKKVSAASVDEVFAANREVLRRHVVRKLIDVKRGDGSQAVDADIPKFVAAIPDSVVAKILRFAADEDNFRDVTPASDPEAIAKKS